MLILSVGVSFNPSSRVNKNYKKTKTRYNISSAQNNYGMLTKNEKNMAHADRKCQTS